MAAYRFSETDRWYFWRSSLELNNVWLSEQNPRLNIYPTSTVDRWEQAKATHPLCDVCTKRKPKRILMRIMIYHSVPPHGPSLEPRVMGCVVAGDTGTREQRCPYSCGGRLLTTMREDWSVNWTCLGWYSHEWRTVFQHTSSPVSFIISSPLSPHNIALPIVI